MTTSIIQKTITIFIDQQKFQIEEAKYTPAQLLELAGEDPSQTILVLRIGDDLRQLKKDSYFEPKPDSRFVVFHCDPTPVS